MWIIGAGVDATVITAGSTFNTDMFYSRVPGVSESVPVGTLNFMNLSLFGNTQPNCTGIHIADTNFTVIRDVKVKNFQGTNSYGIHFEVISAQCERGLIEHVWSSYNTIGLGFTSQISSGSHLYTRIIDLTSTDWQKGIYVGPNAALRHSYINAVFNTENYGAPNTCTAVWAEADCSNNIWAITLEGSGNGFYSNGLITGTGDVRGNVTGASMSGVGLVAITQPEIGDSQTTFYWNGQLAHYIPGWGPSAQTSWVGFTRADSANVGTTFNLIQAALGMFGDIANIGGGAILWLSASQANDGRGGFKVVSGAFPNPTQLHSLGNNGIAIHSGAVVVGGNAPAVASGSVAIGTLTSTTASAGSATALPAAPAGYFQWFMGGTAVKVPFYFA